MKNHMNKWYHEEYSFKITVLSVNPDNKPENHCRNGHEVGDEFHCEYGCSNGFCSKSMSKLFPLMEAVRSGGDLRNLGGIDQYVMEFDCPDGIVRFKLEAAKNETAFPAIQPIHPADRKKVNQFIQEHWYSTDILIRGEVIDMTTVDGFVIMHASSDIIGLITYIFRDDYCEITSLNAETENQGIGTALIHRVIAAAEEAGCRKLKLLTTNDNIRAIHFYQKRGFNLLRINQGAIDRERLLKPEIPLLGNDGIPLKHEVEFEMDLD